MSRRPLLAAALLATVLAAGSATAKSCNSPAELKAMQVRQLHYDLMVASLKCEAEYGFRGKWAAYNGKFGPALSQNAGELKAMFQRQGKGANHLDRYATQLSNDAQIRSQGDYEYCDKKAAIYDRLAEAKPAQLSDIAADVVGAPEYGQACPAKQQTVKKEPAKKVEPVNAPKG